MEEEEEDCESVAASPSCPLHWSSPKDMSTSHMRSVAACLAVNYQMSFAHKAYEKDVYSATESLRTYTDQAVHVGQVLSTNGLQHVRLPADSV